LMLIENIYTFANKHVKNEYSKQRCKMDS
jgi:hypothetical protein